MQGNVPEPLRARPCQCRTPDPEHPLSSGIKVLTSRATASGQTLSPVTKLVRVCGSQRQAN